jgi:hypothetical protein
MNISMPMAAIQIHRRNANCHPCKARGFIEISPDYVPTEDLDLKAHVPAAMDER